jgi:hypothetical protein
MHDPIALERSEVRTDGIIGDADRLAQLLDRPRRSPQLRDYLSSGRHQKLAVPIHRSPLTYSISR